MCVLVPFERECFCCCALRCAELTSIADALKFRCIGLIQIDLFVLKCVPIVFIGFLGISCQDGLNAMHFAQNGNKIAIIRMLLVRVSRGNTETYFTNRYQTHYFYIYVSIVFLWRFSSHDQSHEDSMSSKRKQAADATGTQVTQDDESRQCKRPKTNESKE